MRLVKRRNRHPHLADRQRHRSKGLLSLTSTSTSKRSPIRLAARSPSPVQVADRRRWQSLKRAIVAGGEIERAGITAIEKRRRSQPRGAACCG